MLAIIILACFAIPTITATAFENADAIKMVLIGPSGVGKTCFAERWIRGRPPTTAIDLPTIGAAFHKRIFTFPQSNTSMRVDLWDTAGQERFAGLMPMYIRGAHVVVVVYDVSSVKSYGESIAMLERNQTHINKEDALLILVGTKSDLLKNITDICENIEDREDAEWRRLGFSRHYIVSAFAPDRGFEVVVSDMADLIHENFKTLTTATTPPSQSTRLSRRENPQKKHCCY